MIMSNIGFSYIAIHPGEVLKEELESRNISQKDFAKAISVSYTMHLTFFPEFNWDIKGSILLKKFQSSFIVLSI